jgi:hypothetical protein
MSIEYFFSRWTQRDFELGYLRFLNRVACLFHGIQAGAALYMALSDSTFTSFEPPLLTSFAEWNQTMGASPAYQIRGRIPFAYVTCAVPLLSAIAHAIIASDWGWPKYKENVKKMQNPWRWFEYAISSSLMIVLVAILFAIYDISLLLMLFSINLVVMYTGRNMDRANPYKGDGKLVKTDWEPFIAGSFLAGIEWIVIYITLFQFDWSRAPLYIVPLLFTYFVLFLSFAANQAYFYAGLRTLERMVKVEKIFMVLSLSAKSLLLWLIFFGTRQPHEKE